MDWQTATLIAAMGTTIQAGTPLVFAALGELVTEKAGVLNLGIEGMMLAGAVVGFVAAMLSGSLLVGVVAAALAGMLLALIFGVLTLNLQANQVATGLALTIFGIGLSAFIGQDFVGLPLPGLAHYPIPVLSEIPFLGPLLFDYDPLVYLSWLAFIGISIFLYRTRAGLILRAVGESPSSAHAIGYPVIVIRYLAVLFGGAMSGLAGAYLSLAYTPMWAEQMSAGRGWIALALVVFATWKPGRVMLGAYLFGGVTFAQLHVQSAGFAVSSHLLSMLPYLATIVVLVLISRDATKIRLNAPGSLGQAYHPDA